MQTNLERSLTCCWLLTQRLCPRFSSFPCFSSHLFFFSCCFLCSLSLSLCPILHLLYLLPLWQLSVQLPTSTASPSRQQRVLQLKEISLFSGLLFLQQEVQRIICRHECKTGTQDFLAHVKIWCSDWLSLKNEIFQEYQKCIINAYSKLILNVHVVCVYSVFCSFVRFYIQFLLSKHLHLQYFTFVVSYNQLSCKTTYNPFSQVRQLNEQYALLLEYHLNNKAALCTHKHIYMYKQTELGQVTITVIRNRKAERQNKKWEMCLY